MKHIGPFLLILVGVLPAKSQIKSKSEKHDEYLIRYQQTSYHIKSTTYSIYTKVKNRRVLVMSDYLGAQDPNEKSRLQITLNNYDLFLEDLFTELHPDKARQLDRDEFQMEQFKQNLTSFNHAFIIRSKSEGAFRCEIDLSYLIADFKKKKLEGFNYVRLTLLEITTPNKGIIEIKSPDAKDETVYINYDIHYILDQRNRKIFFEKEFKILSTIKRKSYSYVSRIMSITLLKEIKGTPTHYARIQDKAAVEVKWILK